MEKFGAKKLPSWGHRDRLRALLVAAAVAPQPAADFLRAFFQVLLDCAAWPRQRFMPLIL